MATNKIITVTTIPTRTGDTVASYNAYSSVDGLLGTLTPAEAAAGKTFALSDGASHNVTVKTVWTTAGESTTNESNIVVVDLTSSQTTIIPGDGTTAWGATDANITTGSGLVTPNSNNGGSFTNSAETANAVIPFNQVWSLKGTVGSTAFSGNGNRMIIGITVNSITDQTTLTHCILTNLDSNVIIVYELGSNVAGASVGTPALNDVMEIRNDGSGNITYYQNDTLIWTSASTMTTDSKIGVIIYGNEQECNTINAVIG